MQKTVGMDLHVREATLDDLDAVATITREHRRRLSTFGPRWWHPADGADEIHPLWLGHLISSDLATVRVLESEDGVVASAVALAQPDAWFIDDVAVAEGGQWSAVAPALVVGIPERPALTCVASGDGAQSAAFEEAGFVVVSSYWMRGTELGPIAGSPYEGDVPGDPPPHTFGGAFDPAADGALAFSLDGGIVIGSPSTPAPPIYDPGGPVTIVDRVVGRDLEALLQNALAMTAARGDVVLAVVSATDDHDLAAALAATGFDRTVDVHRWPSIDHRPRRRG